MENNRKAKLALIVLLIFAVLVTVYPVISNYLHDKHRSRVQTEYFAAIERMDDTAIQKARQEAEAYNALLSRGVSPAFSKDQISTAATSYEGLLNLNGDETMCYIEIPVIAAGLPVAHGTEAETLERAVGHVLGSSLPIGGSSTHAVLSGHSGMAGQKMFTDLHELKAGDMVYIHVLDEELAYEVYGTEVVLPEDTEKLAIAPGEDLLTLITCTPVGVNTHRLLVHCGGVENISQKQAAEENIAPAGSSWLKQYLTGLGYGAAASVFALATHGIIKKRREKHGKRA